MAKNYSNKRCNNNESYAQHTSPEVTPDVVSVDGSSPTKIDKAYGWYASSKNAYCMGRQLGWLSYMSMDRRKFNKSYFMRGVKKGYNGRRAFEKCVKKDGSAAKCPKWAQSSAYEK